MVVILKLIEPLLVNRINEWKIYAKTIVAQLASKPSGDYHQRR